MYRQRKNLVLLLASWLVVVGFASNASTFADETTENGTPAGESTKGETTKPPATVTVELNAEAPQQKRSSPLGGTSKFLKLILSARNKAAAEVDDQAKEAEPADQGQTFQATHQQVALLKVTPRDTDLHNTGDRKGAGNGKATGWGVKSFCLDGEDNLLVAVGDATAGQLQLLNSLGERQQVWDLSIVPEAVNVDSEGNYLVAGAGKILKLDMGGEVLLEAPSPLVAHFDEHKAEIRQQVIQQIQARSKSTLQQRERYQQRLDRLTAGTARRLDRDEHAEFLMLQKRIASLSAADAAELTVEEQNAWALRKVLFRMLKAKLEQQLTRQEIRTRDIYRKQLKQLDEYAKVAGGAEPSEEQIEQSLTKMVAYKSRLASISAIGNEVFIATGSAQGYGYDVWRLDENLQNPAKIVSQLRGCCGQMDVQACEAGLFVAENSRHQVRHFDRTGKKVNDWGGRARAGVRGFGSCCNPMNVAFGPDGTIYTAESNSGRIKRYSPEGQLIDLVGSVELVPGCKKVSIAVSKDHQRVYMLDITRNHIIVMEAKPGEPEVVSQEEPKIAS